MRSEDKYLILRRHPLWLRIFLLIFLSPIALSCREQSEFSGPLGKTGEVHSVKSSGDAKAQSHSQEDEQGSDHLPDEDAPVSMPVVLSGAYLACQYTSQSGSIACLASNMQNPVFSVFLKIADRLTQIETESFILGDQPGFRTRNLSESGKNSTLIVLVSATEASYTFRFSLNDLEKNSGIINPHFEEAVIAESEQASPENETSDMPPESSDDVPPEVLPPAVETSDEKTGNTDEEDNEEQKTPPSPRTWQFCETNAGDNITVALANSRSSADGNSTIRCNDEDQNIVVANAFWGRVSQSICNDPLNRAGVTNTTTCTGVDLTQSIAALCDDSGNCNVDSFRTNEGAGSDPCSGIYKYLQVTFTCHSEEN